MKQVVASERRRHQGVNRIFCLGIPPTPDRAPNPHFLEKRVSGSKTPISTRPGKGGFCQKIPFSLQGNTGKWGFLDRKLPFPARVRGKGNGGFWTPKPSFPRNGDSGPCLGSGGSQFLSTTFGFLEPPVREVMKILLESFHSFPTFDHSPRGGVGDPNFVDTNSVDISISLRERHRLPIANHKCSPVTIRNEANSAALLRIIIRRLRA